MVLNFKYNIGDEVRLIREPSDKSSLYMFMFNSSEKAPDTTFKINGWGWTEKEPGIFEQYYRLKDDTRYLKYHNKILEDELEPVGEVHPFDDDELVYKSVNGDEIAIGTKAYSSVYFGGEDSTYIDTDFTFTSYGSVKSIEKFCEGRTYLDRRVNLSIETDKEYNKENQYWELYSCDKLRKSSEFPYLLLTNPKSGFAEEYITKLFSKKNSKVLIDESHHDYHLVHEWLEHMGILDEVMELYNNRKSGKEVRKPKPKTKKKSTKKDDKLLKLLEGLSEEDKKKLRDLL